MEKTKWENAQTENEPRNRIFKEYRSTTAKSEYIRTYQTKKTVPNPDRNMTKKNQPITYLRRWIRIMRKFQDIENYTSKTRSRYTSDIRKHFQLQQRESKIRPPRNLAKLGQNKTTKFQEILSNNKRKRHDDVDIRRFLGQKNRKYPSN